MKKIKTVLVSVFNKDGIDNFCEELHKNNITILNVSHGFSKTNRKVI